MSRENSIDPAAFFWLLSTQFYFYIVRTYLEFEFEENNWRKYM